MHQQEDEAFDTMLYATLCFLMRGNEVLLGEKTIGAGKGFWNGYRAGRADGAKAKEMVVDGLWHETGGILTTPRDIEEAALVNFRFVRDDGRVVPCRVRVFVVKRFLGELKPTEAIIKPTWFGKNELPLKKLMEADKELLPLILSGRKIIADITADPFHKPLEEVKLRIVNCLPE